jgi:hypothetical protein
LRGKVRFHDLDIARLGVVDALGAAEIRRGGEALVERIEPSALDGEFGSSDSL